MESTVATAARSGAAGGKPDDAVPESLKLGEEIRSLMAAPPESSSSFTALLGLPPTRAMELLHSSAPTPAHISGESVPLIDHRTAQFYHLGGNLTFPSNTALIERAAEFSVFAGENNSPDTSSPPLNSSASLDKVKNEPTDTDSDPNSLQQHLVSQPAAENNSQRAAKRKEPEKKGKGSTKKSKHEISEETEKLPYVHVRARRGQATDSHSLAERARREKINARMKLLQELVPGCNKISGTALVLDEIINHVQCLQQQVEFLSMRLAAVKPRTDFNLDGILAAQLQQSGSLMDSNSPGMVMWHVDAVQQQSVWVRDDDSHDFRV